MSLLNKKKKGDIKVTNVGTDLFNKDLKQQGLSSAQVDWKPVAGGKPELIEALDYLKQPHIYEKIKKANLEVVKRIKEAHPVLIGYKKAIDVIPGMTKNTFLHAGPPMTWDQMNGSMRGAVIAAILYEQFAKTPEEAIEVAQSDKVIFKPNHELSTVGAMAGVTSASMWVHVVKNKTHGNLSFSTISEQSPKILRFGAYDETVINRLNWMRDVEGPILSAAVEKAGEIDIRALLAQAIQMGDEDHNRNIAGTLLLIQALTPHILELEGFSWEDKIKVIKFINSHPYFSGLTWMALCKAVMDSAHGVENSTIVTTMNRNGTEFGIRVSHDKGFKWYTGPAQRVVGSYLAGYGDKDAGLDIGDSAITETFGIGGFAMAAAPAIAAYVGEKVENAINFSKKMVEITSDLHPSITIPYLNFRGISIGIDVMKVIEKQILPVIDTAIAHKDAGIGMIGAGITYPPMETFEKAILSLAKSIK